jgi:Immunoglobulin-like domain of bacterial spore germination
VAAFIKRLRERLCRALCGAGPDVCSNADGALTNESFIFVTSPRSGERVSSGFTARGCSRTFESNVPWRLVDETGTELASGSTLGGGVDGPGPFSFTVAFTVASRQIGHLEVNEDDPSGGEGPRKPTRNVIPLVLRP